MNKISFNILRIGLAITFLWIGILIFKDPEAWGGYLSQWVVELLPMPIKEIMLGTAILDMAIGIFLLVNSFVWIAAGVGAIHLIIILIVTGITDITVRDIGILAGMIALMVDSLPANFIEKIKQWRKGNKI